MLSNASATTILPPDLSESFGLSQLREQEVVLGELPRAARERFIQNVCGGAHHFPWQQNQNPECCTVRPSNPCCTHEEFVTAEFRFIFAVTEELVLRAGLFREFGDRLS